MAIWFSMLNPNARVHRRARRGGAALVATVAAVLALVTDGNASSSPPRPDCTLYSGTPTSSSLCGTGNDDLVGVDANDYAYRTLISVPDRIQIPPHSRLTSANLTIDVLGTFGSTPTSVFAMTRAFAPGAASWDSYDGVHPWGVPGGDFDQELSASATVTHPGTVSFPVTQIVRRWLNSSDPLQSFILVPQAREGNAYSLAPTGASGGPSLSLSWASNTQLPTDARPRSLHIKVRFRWDWNGPITRLSRVHVAKFPRHATLTLECRGRGCPGYTISAEGKDALRLLKSLVGHRYHAGYRLVITITAPGFRPERGVAVFRNGEKPLMKR
jgi:hypothetical protein